MSNLEWELTESKRREAEFERKESAYLAAIDLATRCQKSAEHERDQLTARVKTLDDALEPYQSVIRERAAQDTQWGGSEHDDTHDWRDWRTYILYQINYLTRYNSTCLNGPLGSVRARFVKAAALAVAAIESIDRKQALAAKEPKA